MKRTVVALSTVALVGAVLLASRSTDAKSDRPDWVDPDTGQVLPEKMPDRIRIGTDLYDSGVAWIDTIYFKAGPDRGPGPFMIYATEDSKEPAYWYYTDDGIVPIGTPPSGRTADTVGVDDSDK